MFEAKPNYCELAKSTPIGIDLASSQYLQCYFDLYVCLRFAQIGWHSLSHKYIQCMFMVYLHDLYTQLEIFILGLSEAKVKLQT